MKKSPRMQNICLGHFFAQPPKRLKAYLLLLEQFFMKNYFESQGNAQIALQNL